MAIESLVSCELSGIRRSIGDPSGTSYSDSDLRGYVTDALLELRMKYTYQEFEISGGYITPEPDYDEQSFIDLQTKIQILKTKQYTNATAGGISYQDPVQRIDTKGVPKNLYDLVEMEENKLDKLIQTKNKYKLTPVGKPSWQTSADAWDDTSLNLNIISE